MCGSTKSIQCNCLKENIISPATVFLQASGSRLTRSLRVPNKCVRPRGIRPTLSEDPRETYEGEGSKQAAKSKRRMQAAGVSRIPPRKRPRTKDDDEDDLGNKLALRRLKPWAESSSPPEAINRPKPSLSSCHSGQSTILD